MADCCSSSDLTSTPRRKHRCPVNGQEYSEVSVKTIAHHVKNSWLRNDNGQRYFFCDDPDCDVVYFGEDGSAILKSQLRTAVGVKESSDDGLLCYCFGISKADATNPRTREYAIQQTRLGLCSCETSNPSGRCCLNDFPKEPSSS